MRSFRAGRSAVLSLAVFLVVLLASCADSSSNSAETTTTAASAEATTSTTIPPSTTVTIPVEAEALDELLIVGVEFGDAGFVRVRNRGSADANVDGIFLCQFARGQTSGVYVDLGQIVPGGVIAAGDIVEVPADQVGGLDSAGGEAALYANSSNFGSPDNIMAYVQWGTGGERASVATAANIWAGEDVTITPDLTQFNDIVLDGDPVDPENWS